MRRKILISIVTFVIVIAGVVYFPTGNWTAEYCKSGICLQNTGLTSITRTTCPKFISIFKGYRFVTGRAMIAKDYDQYFLKPDTCVVY